MVGSSPANTRPNRPSCSSIESVSTTGSSTDSPPPTHRPRRARSSDCIARCVESSSSSTPSTRSKRRRSLWTTGFVTTTPNARTNRWATSHAHAIRARHARHTRGPGRRCHRDNAIATKSLARVSMTRTCTVLHYRYHVGRAYVGETVDVSLDKGYSACITTAS